MIELIFTHSYGLNIPNKKLGIFKNGPFNQTLFYITIFKIGEANAKKTLSDPKTKHRLDKTNSPCGLEEFGKDCV